MTYTELTNKVKELREQGKSEDEILELLRDDIKQAAEYCFEHPEEKTTAMRDLLSSVDPKSPMLKLLFGIIGTNMFEPKK